MTDASSITLLDNTLPEIEPEPESPESSQDPSLGSGHPKSLTKRFTRTSVRENLARRKYAKWQKDRYDDQGEARSRENSVSRHPSLHRERAFSLGKSSIGTERSETEGPEVEVNEGESQSEIEVLYENQRGYFFFGMPYFSANSLLNLDPAAWVTKNLEVSPVDITNAQPPDPSWEWAWQTWYIDMSYDVDEEGWQYSFSFASKFAWHGTHPWFHSFVRRRRWLRKRVKKGVQKRQKITTDDRGQAYSTMDDFLAARTASRSLKPASIGADAPSTLTTIRHEEEDVISPDEITNPIVLMRALKKPTLDREKIEVVKSFVHLGGEELIFLEEKIPEIMSMLVFHTSKRQLVELLVDEISKIPEDTKDDAEGRRRAHLFRAVEAIRDHYRGLEFWGDVDASIRSVKGKEPIGVSQP